MGFFDKIKEFSLKVTEVENSIYGGKTDYLEIYERNLQLEKEIEQRTKELNLANKRILTLQHILDMMNSAKPLQSVLENIVNSLQGELGYLHSNIVRVTSDEKGEYMYVTNVYDNYINFNGKPFNVFEYESRSGKYKLCEVDDLAKFTDFEINKILTTSDPEYLQANYQEMMAPFKDTLSCMFTGPFYFEFTAQGIDKAKALDAVLKPMGYKQEEMIAFGDGQNDASMVKYAGLGVAMANAVDELKEISQYITGSNDEDGIADALYKFIPELND